LQIIKYLLILSSFLFTQDIAGSYKFTGLYIWHQSVARYNTSVIVSDTHDLGVTLPIDEIQAGEIYRTTYQGPYGHLSAEVLNVILNVNFNEDGTGQIAEGSYYPTEILDSLTCLAEITILPITDELVYTSDLEAGNIIPSTNIIGSVPGPDNTSLPYPGMTTGCISLSQTNFFDFFPCTPVHPTLCDGLGNCFDVTMENGETIAGGDPLPGFAGGYVLKDNLPTIVPSENDGADLYIEWHAIDGRISGSGLGDILGQDEDDDGTDFDRIWGMEFVICIT
jgi:hypothetical protein